MLLLDVRVLSQTLVDCQDFIFVPCESLNRELGLRFEHVNLHRFGGFVVGKSTENPWFLSSITITIATQSLTFCMVLFFDLCRNDYPT